MKQKLFTVVIILAVLLGLFSRGQALQRVKAAEVVCYVDVTATGANGGSSWGDAYQDLQAALGDSSCTEIHVAAGIYHPSSTGDFLATFQMRNDLKIIGGYSTGGDTSDPTSNPTILDGETGDPNYLYDNSWNVVTGDGTDSSAVLDGFTISNAYAVGDMLGYGGGITISDGSPTLKNLVITGNTANGGGGGIYMINSSPTLRNLVISGNTTFSDGGGAGIYLRDSSPTLTDITITGNGGPSGSIKGGGLLSIGDSNPVLTRVTFDSNTGDFGGGMYCTADDFGISGNPTLIDVTFQNNQAASNGGGGLFIDGGNLSLSDSHFDGNSASDGGGIFINSGSLAMQNTRLENGIANGYGGGLYISGSGSATLGGNSFNNNTAHVQGGGLYVEGSIAMVGATISQNTGDFGGGGIELVGVSSADFVNLVVDSNFVLSTGQMEGQGQGGGIFATSSTASFTNLLLTRNYDYAYQGGGMSLTSSNIRIVNATIANNDDQGLPGSAIYNDNNLYIANTIVSGHSDANPSITSATTVNASLLEDGCPSGADCTGLVPGNPDPQFVNLQTPDYRVLPTSPALDAGDVSALPSDTYDLDGDGNSSERISQDLRGKPRVAGGTVDIGAYERQAGNINWTEAMEMPLAQIQPDVYSDSLDRYVDMQGQSQWFKFTVQPDSKVLVTLTNLAANYDLTLYKDISEAYDELNSSQDLVHLSAEFAPDTFSPDTFSPDTFSPDTFSPDTFSPDTFSPDTFSPDTFSPDTFSPDTFSPDTFSPDTFSPDTFSPDTFSPDTFSPDTFSPDTFSPDTFSPDTFSPDTFSSAQTRSLIAVSAHEGTQGEGILVNTWTKSGYFYLRVRGRNGAFNSDVPFHLQVTMLTGTCGSVSPVQTGSSPTLPEGGYQTLILTNLGQTEGTAAEKLAMQTRLTSLASRTGGYVLDVGGDGTLVGAFADQAQANAACVYAMNLEAGAIKNIADDFRKNNPDLHYIVLVGNDHAIPFFRYTDDALLASETGFSPPVLDDTTSQASLKSGYILSQDAYGSSEQVSYKADTLPVPDLAVGRLVETASDINHLLDAYLGTDDGVITPTNALVTGYDFLADDANAVRDELQAGLGSPAAVDTLIDENTVSPEDPTAWTADDLRHSLLDSSHGVVFLAGHFSASSALAADYKTHLLASEVAASSTNFINSLVYSAGCHSGYNIVNADGVPGVTVEPDWAQVFAEKGATFIGGTGYQYGDTDFIEYSERLYLEFTRQLRYGSGPVAVGKALVQAKQAYLAATPVMRGIHEKTMLEATLFGLPMLQFDLSNRTPAPHDDSLVTSSNSFANNPGHALGLRWADLHVTPTFTDHTVVLDQASTSGGTTTVNAFYLSGPSGVVVNPSEPVLPLDMLNVTFPETGYVLRGAGWLGGNYTNMPGVLPLTGAATEDLRAPHTPFFSDTFYPVRPWNINYFDALDSTNGPTRLALAPAQYRSTDPGSLTGVLRRFDTMDFRLYYSGNFDTYTNSDHNWTNTPALSAPPDISHISSSIIDPDGTVDPDGSTVYFEITVTGDPAAGIQEAWIVYTFENGTLSGAWGPLELEQDPKDTRLWKGSLDLDSAPAASLRYIVEAANGVGLVTMMTNQGAYYRAAVDPGALPQGRLPVTLTLESPAASGPYGGQQAFTALVTQEGSPLAGLPVTFSLDGQSGLAVTGNDGRASVNFYLATAPGDYTFDATFDGNDTFTPADGSSPFEIQPGDSSVALTPKTQTVPPGVSIPFSATVKSSGLPLSGKPVALTLSLGGVTKFTGVAVTDFNGQASWNVPGQDPGNYAVKAWFAQSVSSDLDLSSPYYQASSDTAALTVSGTKTDMHVTADNKTILYGDTPAFTVSFKQSDIIPSYPTTEISGITCSAGAGPFTPAHSPYTISCTGGTSTHYNLIYATGKLYVNLRPLYVTPNPSASTAQYSDPNPSLFTPSYSNWAPGEGSSVLTKKPFCSTTRTVSSPAGAYDITCSGGAGANYTFAYVKGTFTANQEDASLEYSGDSLALVNSNLNLRVTVWDSAAAGYPSTAANPESKPKATLGDIIKMWVQFNIYPASTCGTSTSIAPVYARVSDAPTNGDGIGTASATYKSTSEASYCVIARLVAGTSGGVNQYYTAPDAQSAAVSFYQNSGKFATGGGWIKDPNGFKGSFSFVSRNDAKGKPLGQLVYIYRGTYNGIPAVFIIRSGPLTALQFIGTKYPLTMALQGKCTIWVIRAFGGAGLYSDLAATFKAVVVDTNKNPGTNSDSFALIVWDKNGVIYKMVPTSLLSLGNVVIHLK